MAIELVRATPERADELSRLFFEAFRTLHERHRVPLDIASLEVASHGMDMFLSRPDMYGVMALDGGKVVGHNFLQLSDEVAGVGPVCVDPACQSRGVGKMLMQHVTEWALKNHGPMVRLLQESVNTTSLRLYASLGYAVREPVLKMVLKPAPAADASVRPLTMDDLAACDVLCRQVYRISRRNELARMIQHGSAVGLIPHGRFRDGQVAAYVIPGFFGYGVAVAEEDLLATAEQAARVSPPPMHIMLVPVRNTQLFNGALRRGWRSEKLLNLMTVGPYEEPQSAWAPSIGF